MTMKQKDVGVIGMFQGFSPEQLETAERKMVNGNISQSEIPAAEEE